MYTVERVGTIGAVQGSGVYNTQRIRAAGVSHTWGEVRQRCSPGNICGAHVDGPQVMVNHRGVCEIKTAGPEKFILLGA